MKYKVKKNTEVGGVALHNAYGYALCPFTGNKTPCGSWCALFHYYKSRGAVNQGCSSANVTIFVSKEDKNEEISKSSK